MGREENICLQVHLRYNYQCFRCLASGLAKSFEKSSDRAVLFSQGGTAWAEQLRCLPGSRSDRAPSPGICPGNGREQGTGSGTCGRVHYPCQSLWKFPCPHIQPVHDAAATATISLSLNSYIPKAAHTTPRGKPGVPSSTHPSQLVTQIHLVLCLKNMECGVSALHSSLLCLNGVKSPYSWSPASRITYSRLHPPDSTLGIFSDNLSQRCTLYSHRE